MFTYEMFWNVDYKEYPNECSKKFDDFVERSKMHAYSINFVLKSLIEQNYNEL